MSLSSILDISSFFIGMIINMIFVALMCYYFKRKYDYLEMAQTEQAKILYQMIHKNADKCTVDYSKDPLVHMDSESDSDSDEESVVPEFVPEVEVAYEVMPADISEKTVNLGDMLSIDISDLDISEESRMEPVIDPDMEPVIESREEPVMEPFEITVQLSEPENTYSKMSMKQLKEILSSKGIRAKNNIKKDELIELISKEV